MNIFAEDFNLNNINSWPQAFAVACIVFATAWIVVTAIKNY